MAQLAEWPAVVRPPHRYGPAVASRFDDEIWERVPDGPPDPALAAFVRELGAHGDVLDLGCGDGRLSAELAARQLTLADVSPAALARAAARLPGAAAVELEPDAPLPHADNGFDLVLCCETIEHVRDTQLLLSEARRVLRPGGTLALTTPSHSRLTGAAIVLGGFERGFDPRSAHLRFFTARSLGALLDDTGFDIASLERRAGTLYARATR